MNPYIIEQCPSLYIGRLVSVVFQYYLPTDMISLIFLACILNFGNAINEFPSLMTSNASMAVVIDKSFFLNKIEYYNTIKIIHKMVTDITKEEMYMGGIVVNIFRNTKVTNLRDYTVMLSVANCQQTWLLHAAARKEQLVHLAVTEQDCPRFPDTEGVSVPLIIPGKEISQIIFDVRSIDALSWNNVNILHDDTFDKDTINRVTKAISIGVASQRFNLVSRTLFAFKHADSERSRKYYIKDMLETFQVDQLGKCFLIIVTMEAAADVMEVAKTLKMVQPDSQWLYLIADSITRNSTNITSFVDLLSEGGNVAFVYNATESDTICDASLICHIKELVTVFTYALKISLMTELELYGRMSDEEFEILRISKNKRRVEILKNIKIKLIEDSLTGGACGKCLYWRFASAITWGNFFMRGKSSAHLLDSGEWMPTLGLNLTDVIFPHVAHGFRGISLPVATYHNPPWQTIMLSNSGEKEYGGLVFDVVRYLGKKLNFTYSVLSPASNRTIKFTYNESIADVILTSTTRTLPMEIIDLVRMNKVLFAACAYTVNDRGRDDTNFTLPIFIQTYSFLTAKPGQLSRALLFAAPFSKETWACLAASVLVMGPTLFWIHKNGPSTLKQSGLNSSWQCIWYVYGALLQQGGMYLPRSDSARLLVGVWWLIVMVVVATYSGSLVAFLTFPNTDTAILTVEELIENKDRITWGFPNGSYLKEYLKSSEEKKYHILLDRAIIHNVTQEATIMKKVRAGKHALIDWRSTLRFAMKSDLMSTTGCGFSLSTDEFMDEPIAMIISQDSPYTSIINGELYRMHESGLMNKWIAEQIPMKDKCSESFNQAVEERKVNVADMQGIFFVLFIGVAGAIFLLCCEFFWHRRQASKRRNIIQPFLS